MKRTFIIIFFLILIILLQSSNIIETIKIGNIKPNLVLIYLIFISLNSTEVFSINLGFWSGILMDILSQTIIGINSLCYTLLSYILNSLKTKVYSEKAISALIITFIVSIIFYILFFSLIYIFSERINFQNALIKIVLPVSVYNSILSIPLFSIFNSLFVKKLWQKR